MAYLHGDAKSSYVETATFTVTASSNKDSTTGFSTTATPAPA